MDPRRLAEIFSRIVGLSLEAVLGETGAAASPTQLRAIAYALRYPGCAVGALAEGMKVSQPAATKMAARLEARGWLRREEDPKDHRISRLWVTPKGRGVLVNVVGEHTKRITAILGLMPSGEKESLLRGLQGFVVAAVRQGVDPERICLRCGIEHTAECPVEAGRRAMVARPARHGEG